jgi:hypothetical protein
MWQRVQLHFNLETDGQKLPRWHCVRGTNLVESWHVQVREWLGGGGWRCTGGGGGWRCGWLEWWEGGGGGSLCCRWSNVPSTQTCMHCAVQLHDLLDGGNNSPEYYVERVTFLSLLWNIATREKRMSMPAYGVVDLPMLARINELRRSLQKVNAAHSCSPAQAPTRAFRAASPIRVNYTSLQLSRPIPLTAVVLAGGNVQPACSFSGVTARPGAQQLSL